MKTENKSIAAFNRFILLSNIRYPIISAGILFLCSFSSSAFCQQKAQNAFYLETASKGPVYSLNYDRIVRQGEKLDYSIRVGFSIERNAFSFPVGFNVITGHHNHHAEFCVTAIPYFQYYPDEAAGNYSDKSDKYIYIHPNIGYRFQKPERSVFFKVAAGPSIALDPQAGVFWNMDPKVDFFGSVAAGISF